jgi:hypothetical protein
MSASWMDPLEREEEERIISQVAGVIGKRKLETPAILFLEMHRPLANVGSHAVVAFAPFVAPFLGSDQTSEMSRLLATPGAVERLIQKLEEQRVQESVSDSIIETEKG